MTREGIIETNTIKSRHLNDTTCRRCLKEVKVKYITRYCKACEAIVIEAKRDRSKR